MIGYNNVQGFGVAKQELMKHLLRENNLDIIALSETKRNDDHPVTELAKNYNWIGKNRMNGRDGGIGFVYNSKTVTLADDSLLNSKSDEFEWLWISFKVEKCTMALGIVYFPVDNVASLHDDAVQLHNELLQNIGELQHRYANILLIGDFNGKSTIFRKPGKPSSNGPLIDNLTEATDMVLLNSSEKCTGTITWARGAQQSTID